MPWKPSVPGEVPTLGWLVIDWITEYLAAPARVEYEPFVPYLEQEDFILRWYEINPETGRFRHSRGLIGRARGWGKSPILAALSGVEALAPCLPAGWDADGQPVGRPWSDVRTPLVHIAAVSEQQTANTWQPLLEMLRNGPAVDEFPGLEPLDTVVFLPGAGRIEQVTASARSVKGAPSVFAVLDQTEEWVPSVGGPRLAQTLRTNCTKNGGRTVESPNAYMPGDGSVAESTADYAKKIDEGAVREAALLYDHREAPADTDMSDRESLVYGLRVVYGDSSGHPGGCVLHDPPCRPGHVDLDAIVTQIWDPATDPEMARRDFLNQITHASDAWLSQPEWTACRAEGVVVGPGDEITLGFDGSRGRVKGKPDATALVACRVSDGHLWLVDVWEADDNPRSWASWSPPMGLIEETIDDVFRRFRVAAFYCDPARDWRSHVNAWEAKYGGKCRVKETREHPFEWWMLGGRATKVERAIEQLESAIRNKDITHSGDPRLTRHVLNARRRFLNKKLSLGKESSYSSKKIDAAVAAVLAYQGRLDAVVNKKTPAAGFRPIRVM